ncbi:MAG: hypothetical protein KY464_00250 [Gemmatimonadetes bacterium]|nr:hypothetical protein [Gemmatimonadota bacterium]
MSIATDNLLAGWIGMLGGVASGAIIGLYFHREDWMEGYASFRRRMTRLGHISFFGLGFLNMMFAVTTMVVALPAFALRVASIGFIIGAITMPTCCFLTAWRKPFRHLFPIPVAGLLAGVVAMLAGWGAP